MTMGECDVSGCINQAVTVIVGEAGDLWLCVKHRQPEPEQIDGSESGVTFAQTDGRVDGS
jgi:hypothetical protein